MEIIWKKRIMRVLSNFGISFLTPFSGSGVAQSLYDGSINMNEMLVTGLFSSAIYTSLVLLHEVREIAGNE